MVRTLRVVVPLALLVLAIWSAWHLLSAQQEAARLLGIVATVSLSIALVACVTAVAAMARANMLRTELTRLAASTDAALVDLARSSPAAPVIARPDPVPEAIPKPILARATQTQRGLVRDVTLLPILSLVTGEPIAYELARSGQGAHEETPSAAAEADLIAAALAEDDSAPVSGRRRTAHVPVSAAFLDSPEHVERITRMVESRDRLPRGVVLSVKQKLLDPRSRQHDTLVSLHAAGFGLAMEIGDEAVSDIKRNGLVEFIRIPAHRLVARGRPRQGRQSRIAELEHAQSLRIPVIASGNISEEDAETLAALGVDMVLHEELPAPSGRAARQMENRPAQPH